MKHLNTPFNAAEIQKNFGLRGTFSEYNQIHDGHINYTYKIVFEDGGIRTPYLLQKINTDTFRDPDALMENILGVTEHLRAYILEHGGDPDRETLNVIKTVEGKPYYRNEADECYRMYKFITEAYTCQQIENPTVFYNAARAFGDFQRRLADYPSEKLHEILPDFHNTAKRFENLQKAIAENKSGRKGNVAAEIAFAQAREADSHVLVDLLAAGRLPLRVTHNDTKLNNVMFDNHTNKGICVIDLDTVMPGLSLYDFGDSIRFGANHAAEDEKDLSKVWLDLNLFENYVRGYLESTGESLTTTEIEYLPFSAKLLTFECGMRFLTDYLDGDTYFHTNYPDHNLDRCRTQFALVADMEKKMDEMKAIVSKYSR